MIKMVKLGTIFVKGQCQVTKTVNGFGTDSGHFWKTVFDIPCFQSMQTTLKRFMQEGLDVIDRRFADFGKRIQTFLGNAKFKKNAFKTKHVVMNLKGPFGNPKTACAIRCIVEKIASCFLSCFFGVHLDWEELGTNQSIGALGQFRAAQQDSLAIVYTKNITLRTTARRRWVHARQSLLKKDSVQVHELNSIPSCLCAFPAYRRNPTAQCPSRLCRMQIEFL